MIAHKQPEQDLCWGARCRAGWRQPAALRHTSHGGLPRQAAPPFCDCHLSIVSIGTLCYRVNHARSSGYGSCGSIIRGDAGDLFSAHDSVVLRFLHIVRMQHGCCMTLFSTAVKRVAGIPRVEVPLSAMLCMVPTVRVGATSIRPPLLLSQPALLGCGRQHACTSSAGTGCCGSPDGLQDAAGPG